MSRDTKNDAALTDAIRGASPAPPIEEVDWTGLHARINAAAAPLLTRTGPSVPAGSRGARPWWQLLAVWSPQGIPLAGAATVLLMIAAGTLGTGTTGATQPADGAYVTIEEELASGLTAGARPLVDEFDADAMLDVALFFDAEDWR